MAMTMAIIADVNVNVDRDAARDQAQLTVSLRGQAVPSCPQTAVQVNVRKLK